jgi:hypothetical protein
MDIFNYSTDQVWNYENGFYLTSHPTRMAKMLAHFELYKQITNLPGEVLEFGVFKGASLLRFATFREILESPYSRKIIGFDMFGEFPKTGNNQSVEYANKFEHLSGTGIPIEELEKSLKLKQFDNVHLIAGNILETLSDYLKKNQQLKIALLHIDVDVYEPAKYILEQAYERVVRGGIIVLDDYATVEGETKAVDEFFKDQKVTIRKFPFTHIPTYIVKE